MARNVSRICLVVVIAKAWLITMSSWEATFGECSQLTVYFSCDIAIRLAYVSILLSDIGWKPD